MINKKQYEINKILIEALSAEERAGIEAVIKDIEEIDSSRLDDIDQRLIDLTRKFNNLELYINNINLQISDLNSIVLSQQEKIKNIRSENQEEIKPPPAKSSEIKTAIKKK